MGRASISEGAVAGQLEAAGFELASAQYAALTAYLNVLGQWNRVFNLTGIRSSKALVARHLVESLTLGPLLRGKRIADVGTGAGLPGIPLAITEPAREFTLIESRAKRVRFLRHVIGVLGLGNALVEHCRAEDLPIARPFDTVLARAVAPPAQLIEIARPLMAPGSILLILTAEHLGEQFSRLAPERGLRALEQDAAARIPSVIVTLERLDGEES